MQRAPRGGPSASGGASRDRTGDLQHAMLALSQLSYGPVNAPGNLRGAPCPVNPATPLIIAFHCPRHGPSRAPVSRLPLRGSGRVTGCGRRGRNSRARRAHQPSPPASFLPPLSTVGGASSPARFAGVHGRRVAGDGERYTGHRKPQPATCKLALWEGFQPRPGEAEGSRLEGAPTGRVTGNGLRETGKKGPRAERARALVSRRPPPASHDCGRRVTGHGVQATVNRNPRPVPCLW